MPDNIETMVEATQAIARDYQSIRQDLADIKKLLQYPAYVVDMGSTDKAVANSLIKKITGRTFKPGEIIRLNKEEFELYRSMLTCPPRSP